MKDLLLLFIRPVVSNSLRPHGLQHARPLCLSPPPEFAQVHVHCIVMQSSHLILWRLLLLSVFLGLFQGVSCSHQMTVILEFQLQPQSFQQLVRVDFPSDWLACSRCCPGDCQESSPWFKGSNSSALHLLCSSALTTICDHWEDHSLDYMNVCQSNISAFQHTVWVCHSFPAKKQMSSDFMTAVTVFSDFKAQEEKICHYFYLFPICYELMGPNAMILV